MDLKASKCHCGAVSVPPRAHCPRCGRDMVPGSVSGRGKVISYSVLHVPPEGFKAPVMVALVTLESGARVFCHFDKEPGMDADVEVVPELDRYRIKS